MVKVPVPLIVVLENVFPEKQLTTTFLFIVKVEVPAKLSIVRLYVEVDAKVVVPDTVKVCKVASAELRLIALVVPVMVSLRTLAVNVPPPCVKSPD
jgi:hypothetical protein